MNTRIALSTLLALVAAGSSFAQEGTQDFANQTLSTRTRAEVIAELEQARASGQLLVSGELYGSFRPAQIVSTRTRGEVLAELDAARRDGTLQTRNSGPFYGSFQPHEFVSTKTRAEVRAEVLRAQAAGVHLSRGDRSGG